MKKTILLFTMLTTIFTLHAKDIALGENTIQDSMLCEIFSEKVNRFSEDQTSNNSNDKFQYFMERKKEHCSK